MTNDKRIRPLRPEEANLLREVVQKRAPELMALFSRIEANTLARHERLRLCELLGAEFAETGVGADSEPLPRGVKLEELLDLLNRPNLFP